MLLIEHDPAFARLVQVALETAEVDFDVHLVTTLADALDAPVVNVVLLGLNLPDSDGLSSMKGIGMERITATEVRLRSLLAVSFPEPVS